MLQFINDLPPHVVGIHAVGDVTKEDIDTVLLPRLEELAAREGEINYILVLETSITNFTLAAWWEDFKIGIKNFTKWNRIAVVTDQKAVEWFSDAFKFLIPGKSKGFPLSQLDKAVEWVSVHDI